MINTCKITKIEKSTFSVILNIEFFNGVDLTNLETNEKLQNEYMFIQIKVLKLFYKYYLNDNQCLQKWALELICKQKNIKEIVKNKRLILI